MSQHVPDDLLMAFVECDVGEQLAIHIASHLDECPQCAAQAASMEPLSPIFANMHDPVPPPDLVAAVLSASEAPHRVPVWEVSIGAGLLVAAAMLAVVFGDPVPALVDASVQLSALSSLVLKLGHAFPPAAVMLPVVITTGVAGSLLLIRLPHPDSMNLLEMR